ncbi:MAG: sigma-E factor negative regulatory protein [Candidatus Contendobacter sp.]|nr:sigma-E factor negative regulatory protein [Candidatus Contendobacter sp.]
MAEKTAEPLSAPVATDANIELAASQLSAMVDEQLDAMETDLALRRLSRDGGLQARWERYHLISDALQGHLPDALDLSFAARIHQAIAAEPLPQPVARPLPAWYKPVTGFGLAASVALATLVGISRMNPPDAPIVSAPLVSSTTPPPPASLAAAPVRSTTIPLQVAALNSSVNPLAAEPSAVRLNSYLVNHNGYASMNSVHSMLPYVRMVGYQTAGSNR